MSQITLDKMRSDYLDTERELNVAREEEAKRQQEFLTVNAGFQVRDEAVQPGVHDAEAMRDAAVDHLNNSKAQLTALQERQQHLTLKAPADGQLIRVFTPAGSSAKYGDPVAVFERSGTRQIQAFMTQQEALHVSPGQKANVYLPGHWFSIPAKVSDVDYYSMTLGQARGTLQWQNYQNDQFKTVVVTLEPVSDKAAKAMQQIVPGTASTVVFNLL